MSPPPQPPSTNKKRDKKGKSRAASGTTANGTYPQPGIVATATENTPLLLPSSSPASSTCSLPHSPSYHAIDRSRRIHTSSDTLRSHPPPRTSLRSKLLSTFLISLSLTVLLFVFLALLAYSYTSRPVALPPEELVKRALVLKGPDSVQVINVTQTDDVEGTVGVWARVQGRIGIDAGNVLGVNDPPPGAEEDSVWTDIWKRIGRWGVRKVGSIEVELGDITIYDAHKNGKISDHAPLLAEAFVRTPRSIRLPLTVNPPPPYFRDHDSWLTNVTMDVFVKPSGNATVLGNFVREAWKAGKVSVDARVGKATISMLGGWVNVKRTRVRYPVRFPLPPLPPPDNLPIQMLSFHVHSGATHLTLEGTATMTNPIPESPDMPLDVSFPSLPFIVSLPYPPNQTQTHTEWDSGGTIGGGMLPVANVSSSPLALSHPNITVHVQGTSLLPLSPSSLLLSTLNHDRIMAQTILSRFLSTYLQARPNPIVITSPYLPTLPVYTFFPGPEKKPRVVRDVKVKNMAFRSKYVQRGGGEEGGEEEESTMRVVASGDVCARVVLPKGIDVDVEVKRVFVDMLVFDGLPEDYDDDEVGDEGDDHKSSVAPIQPQSLQFPTLTSFPSFPSFPLPTPSLPHTTHFPSLPNLPTKFPFPKPALPNPFPGDHASHEPKPQPTSSVPVPITTTTPDDPQVSINEPPPIPSPLPFPTPLPERAFARVRPEDWVYVVSTPVIPSPSSVSYSIKSDAVLREKEIESDEEDGEMVVLEVVGRFVDVPLEVLPGREAEFRKFVSRVVFSSSGALAGVRGSAAIGVHIQGLGIRSSSDVPNQTLLNTGTPQDQSPFDSTLMNDTVEEEEAQKEGEASGEIDFTGLPFRTEVRIGKGVLLGRLPWKWAGDGFELS